MYLCVHDHLSLSSYVFNSALHRKAEEARKKLRELQEMISHLHDYVSPFNDHVKYNYIYQNLVGTYLK